MCLHILRDSFVSVVTLTIRTSLPLRHAAALLAHASSLASRQPRFGVAILLLTKGGVIEVVPSSGLKVRWNYVAFLPLLWLRLLLGEALRAALHVFELVFKRFHSNDVVR